MRWLILILALLATTIMIAAPTNATEVCVHCNGAYVQVAVPTVYYQYVTPRAVMGSPIQTTVTTKGNPVQKITPQGTPVQKSMPNINIRDRSRTVTRTRRVEREGPPLGGVVGCIVRGLVGRRLD